MRVCGACRVSSHNDNMLRSAVRLMPTSNTLWSAKSARRLPGHRADHDRSSEPVPLARKPCRHRGPASAVSVSPLQSRMMSARSVYQPRFLECTANRYSISARSCMSLGDSRRVSTRETDMTREWTCIESTSRSVRASGTRYCSANSRPVRYAADPARLPPTDEPPRLLPPTSKPLRQTE